MLVSFTALFQAQRGVGINTTTPAATLDVVATTSNNAIPDAVLVPRMTAAELLAKDNNSGTYGDNQNGALVYITSGDGNTTRTNNIRGAGFYYFDSTVPVWRPVGGGGSTAAPRYEAIRGNVSIVTSDTYTLQATDNVVVTRNSSGVAITIPSLTDTAADIGRVIKIINNNTSGGLTFTNGAGNNPVTIIGNLTVNPGRGIEFVWTGTTWSSPQK